MADRMSKGERDDLLRLIRQRERVCKTAAEQRSAALLADFERNISAVYAFDDNDIWKDAYEAAEKAFVEANKSIAAHALTLGIPDEFAPQLHMAWARRGENEMRSRREELRRVAKAEIAALEQTARARIEADSVHAQTEVIANGLSSDAARAFLERLPSVEDIMPSLDFSRVEQKLLEKSKSRNRPEWMQ